MKPHDTDRVGDAPVDTPQMLAFVDDLSRWSAEAGRRDADLAAWQRQDAAATELFHRIFTDERDVDLDAEAKAAALVAAQLKARRRACHGAETRRRCA